MLLCVPGLCFLLHTQHNISVWILPHDYISANFKTLVLLGFRTRFWDSFLCSGNISLALYMIFSFPKFISLFFKNCACLVHCININISFLLSVVTLLLIMVGIKTKPGANSRKNLSESESESAHSEEQPTGSR